MLPPHKTHSLSVVQGNLDELLHLGALVSSYWDLALAAANAIATLTLHLELVCQKYFTGVNSPECTGLFFPPPLAEAHATRSHSLFCWSGIGRLRA
jgi:hypothetical protein